ncbi:M16 family metallopeptidase [Staphylococcus felis]|uniref:M16 family metallopeptidase n=1 Tax=Staphylococcus felis TaxID=46127 RepID=UPI00248108E2|nr:insulinase family protein [Staphylococcus felis]
MKKISYRHIYTLNESMYEIYCQNGFKVILIPRENYLQTEMNLTINFGHLNKHINDTIEIPKGTAHFLEHIIFENNSKVWLDLLETPNIDLNASTNLFRTSFTLSTNKKIDEVIHQFYNSILDLEITESSIKKEREIIKHELSMYTENREWKAKMKLLRNMYKSDCMSTDIIGTMKSIDEINKSILLKAHKYFYTPNNIVLCIIGPVNFHNIKTFLDENTSILIPSHFVPSPSIEEPMTVNKKADYQPNNSNSIYIGYKVLNTDNIGNLKFKLLLDLYIHLLEEESKTLYNDFLITLDIEVDSFKGIANILFFSNAINLDSLENLIDVCKQNINMNSICDSYFNHIILKKKGELLSTFNSSKKLARQIIDNHLQNSDFLKVLTILDSITKEEVLSMEDKVFYNNNKSVLHNFS